MIPIFCKNWIKYCWLSVYGYFFFHSILVFVCFCCLHRQWEEKAVNEMFWENPAAKTESGRTEIRGSKHMAQGQGCFWPRLQLWNFTWGFVFWLSILGLPGFVLPIVLETKSSKFFCLRVKCLSGRRSGKEGSIIVFWWQGTETQLKPDPAKMENVLDLETGNSKGTKCFRGIWRFNEYH